MSCELAQLTVHGYFDGELDAVRATEFERHLEMCPYCRAALQRIESLRAGFEDANLYEHASPELRSRIRRQIGISAQPGSRRVSVSRRALWFGGLATAAMTAAAAVLLVVFLVQPRMERARISASLIDAQVRSLETGHLIDVESSDMHTVKPWFEGKLDFIPPVNDFSEQGFALVGGRLDVIDGHNAAVLVYARRKHFINLFVWHYDKDDKQLPTSGSARGFNWITWQPRDLRFCLMSDVPLADLRELQGLLRD